MEFILRSCKVLKAQIFENITHCTVTRRLSVVAAKQIEDAAAKEAWRLEIQ